MSDAPEPAGVVGLDVRALRIRLILAPLLLLTVAALYFVDKHWVGGRASAAVLGVLALGATWEYLGMMRGAGFPIGRRIPLTAMLLLHVFAFIRVDSEGWRSVNTELYPPVLITVGLVFVLSVRTLARTKMAKGLEEMGATLLGFVLLSWPLYFAQGLALRDVAALLYVVLVAKSGDIGGYVAGILLGRRKLIPHVSPGKSVEGAIGSLVLACLVAWLLRIPLLEPNIVGHLGAVALGVMINLTAQIGDLVESSLKRRCGVKDSSGMLPAHGGVLDLVDSLLFSVPAFFFVLVKLTELT